MEIKEAALNRDKGFVNFLTILSQILIIFTTLLLSWNLIKFTDIFDLPDAFYATSEVVEFLLVFSVATICFCGYYYGDYIIIRLKILVRGRVCSSQRGRTITMLVGCVCVIYVLAVDTQGKNTILDRIDVAATLSIAVAALILQYSLRSDEAKKQKERDMKKYLNAIILRYLDNEKMDTNGIALATNQNSKTGYYGQSIRVEWSFGHFDPANTSVIIITIKKLSNEDSIDQKREYQFIDYSVRAGVVYLQCYMCYSDCRGKETESDTHFPITVEYFYEHEWNGIMLSLYKILNKITVEKEFDRISEKNNENE